MLSRIVVLTNEGPSVSQWFKQRGWDVAERSDVESLEFQDLDGLRENRIQVLITTKQVLTETKGVEYDVLLSLVSMNKEDESLLRQNKRVQTIILETPSSSDLLKREPLSRWQSLRGVQIVQRVSLMRSVVPYKD